MGPKKANGLPRPHKQVFIGFLQCSLLIIFGQSFITFMDALKLNLKAKDQLHPFLTELMSGYSRFKGSQEWEGRGKILHWYVLVSCYVPS